ncbi:unnamed protein product [Haemonchus placei]|uniref:Uncharacterized protein n=1 Tax=Haemonchus placei TaxID=6290 RepID=A0A0N4WUW3_HAEPC|nr:unnamed protein product [Haemonchus placei]
MTVSTQIWSWIIVACVLIVSFYFYNNHKFLTYVYTVDTMDEFSLTIPPSAVSSILENECKWPLLRPVLVSLSNASPRFRSIKCNTAMEPFAFLDEYGFLELSQPNTGGRLIMDTNISCYYHPLSNNTAGKVIIGEPTKVNFNEAIAIRRNQFVVECNRSSPKDVLYRKAFVNVPTYTEEGEEQKFVRSDPEQPSLAILVFDSVSLNQFKRNMPRTTKFLIDNDFFIFNMYNEANRECSTYLSEEIGDFPSILGNMSLDVEHDLRPFHSYVWENTKGYCSPDGHIASHDFLEYWRNTLIHIRTRCHFSMLYLRTLTRMRFEHLPVMDNEVRESLEILKANRLFEDTTFVLLSSRGNPARVKDELFTARVEERSPLFAIKLPEKFLRKNPTQKVAMEYNVNRYTWNIVTVDSGGGAKSPATTWLTTTKDVGMTLMDIANMSFSINMDTPPISQDEALMGASCLRHIHSNWRSCDDAGIPPQLCLCMDKKVLQSDDYTNVTEEYELMFEYLKSEILRNDCLERVEQPPKFTKATVYSLNAMVQQGIKREHDWHHARISYHDLGMKYLEVTAKVFPITRSTDRIKARFAARMMFRSTAEGGLEPVGRPLIRWINHDCDTYEVKDYCEMCYYNRIFS